MFTDWPLVLVYLISCLGGTLHAAPVGTCLQLHALVGLMHPVDTCHLQSFPVRSSGAKQVPREARTGILLAPDSPVLPQTGGNQISSTQTSTMPATEKAKKAPQAVALSSVYTA